MHPLTHQMHPLTHEQSPMKNLSGAVSGTTVDVDTKSASHNQWRSKIAFTYMGTWATAVGKQARR